MRKTIILSSLMWLSNRPQGPVVIEKGKVTISTGTVTLKNDFEAKLGAELEIIAP